MKPDMLPEGFYGRTKLGGELPQSVGNSPDEKGINTLVPEFLFTLKIEIVDIGIICFIHTNKGGSNLPFLQLQR